MREELQNWRRVFGVYWAFVMKLLGLILLFFGVGPAIAEYLGRDIVAFAWIDNWGLEIGFIIKAALIAFGAALFLPGEKPQPKPRPAPPGWTPSRKHVQYPDPVAGLYNRSDR